MDSRATRDSRDPPGPSYSNYPQDGYPSRYDAPVSARVPPVDDTQEVSPTARAVVNAFQAMGRRRGMTLEGSADEEWQLEKDREMEIQKARQKRIRDKVPGRKATGKARTGDIDGTRIHCSPICP